MQEFGSRPPELRFNLTRLDLGPVPSNRKIPFEFYFQNIGGGELKIRDIRATCGCTVALSDRKTVRPGEGGTIRGTLDTHGKTGFVEEHVVVLTNEPVLKPVYELQITGSVGDSSAE